MRTRAINVLEDEMSENTLRHIREYDYLEDWIVDAMINFHKSEVKKLNIPEEKIHKMKISDIIDESILKVYNHLNDFSKEIIKNDNFTINNDIIKNEKDITKKKYKDFFDDKSIKKNVEDYFTNIFISMNEKTKDKFKNMNIDINRDEANGF